MNLRRSLSQITFKDLVLRDLEYYTIINKPPFLSCLEDRNDEKNVLSLARQVHPDYQICHRSDKETSGIVVLAKNPEAYRNFAIQLEDRQVKKVYHAVIHGLHQFESYEAEEPIYTTSSKSRIDFRQGKPSLTLLSTVELFRKHSLVKCFPVSGRMHQIRVHLSHLEGPIVHDPLYGGNLSYLSELKRKFNQKKWEEERPMIERTALHAHEIAFKDMDSKVIAIEATYPKDFSVLVKLLRKYK